MKLLKGRKIAAKILAEISREIRKKKLEPGLAAIFVGKNKSSQIYVNLKEKAARKTGIAFFKFNFFSRTSEKKIINLIKNLNQAENIHGIIVQMPLPPNFDARKIISAINPRKDVDGFLPKSFFQPVFPRAVAVLLKNSKEELKNKKAVIIANSEKFGKAMLSMLAVKKIKADYVIAKRKAIRHPDVSDKIQKADIVISAVGKPGLVSGDIIKKGAIIIDGGIVKNNERVRGDVDFESVKNKASHISPVPGGVGPVTVACLLENVQKAAEGLAKKSKKL